MRISLTVIDTPGFGDQIDNDFTWVPPSAPSEQGSKADIQTYSFAEISGYIERQYDEALGEESRIKRNPRFRDNRVHAVLYFITPTGHA